MIEFAVVGRDEATTLSLSLQQALDARRVGDVVTFVDSGSVDRSAAVASAVHGVRVLSAPIGKGAAIRTLLGRTGADWVVLMDADTTATESNPAEILAEAARRSPGDMVLGDFADREPGGILSNTVAVYAPLVRGLFPEIADRLGSKPLTGFRAIRPQAVAIGQVPSGFGVEAMLNVSLATKQSRVSVSHLGWYEGRFKYKPFMGTEIANGILDQAVLQRRLPPEARPYWDVWVAGVVEVVASYRGDPAHRDAYLQLLLEACARPLPSAGR